MTRQIGRYPAQVIIATLQPDVSQIVPNLDAILADPTTLIINRQDQLNQPVVVTFQETWQPNLTQISDSPSNETKTGLTANAKVELAADKFNTFTRIFNGTLTPETVKAVTTITSVLGIATATLATPHNYTRGDKVVIAGATETAYNGTFTVTSTPSATKFTYAVTGTPTTPATGTPTVHSNDHGVSVFSDNGGLTYGTTELPFYTAIIRPFIGANPTPNPELFIIFPNCGAKGDSQLSYGLQNQWGYSMMLTAYPDPITGNGRVIRGNTALLAV